MQISFTENNTSKWEWKGRKEKRQTKVMNED